MASSTTRIANRLINEKSPYLLQHAYNPVKWYAWNQAAFQAARDERKLIFLSVGYSTCHWCHVMERESFENEDVASIMNEHFINIKVDREERPDVDRVYMTFVQATSGHGGWPMSVFLTADLKPIIGGTYWPPNDSVHGPYRRPGFKTVLRNVAAKWRESNERVTQQGDTMLEALRESINESVAKRPEEAGAAGTVEHGTPEMPGKYGAVVFKCYQQLSSRFEETYGGFSKAPKFPTCVNLYYLLALRRLLDAQSVKPEFQKVTQATRTRALHMVLKQLLRMSAGGVNDHVGGGFHRYSTDQRWHVPHFEKMLYDQAQLTIAYLEASALCRNASDADAIASSTEEDLANEARRVLEYVRRELLYIDSAAGECACYSAEDADSLETPRAGREAKKKEGAYYVWSWNELVAVLGEPDAELFGRVFSVERGGNVSLEQDPHGELRGVNVLHRELNWTQLAEDLEFKSPAELHARLEPALRKLFSTRNTRPRPHRDTKIVTSWNGLALGAFARAHVLDTDESQPASTPSNIEMAKMLYRFIRRHLFDSNSRQLYRTAYAEPETSSDAHSTGAGTDIETERPSKMRVVQLAQPIFGFLDDYTFVISGLLDLFEATHCTEYLAFAFDLQAAADERFLDSQAGGYYETAGVDQSIVLRLKDDQDGAEPSGNSRAAINLLRLASFAQICDKQPQAQATSVCSAADYEARALNIIKYFEDRLKKLPLAMPELCTALLRLRAKSELDAALRHRLVLIGSFSASPQRAALKRSLVHQFALRTTTKSAMQLAIVDLDDNDSVAYWNSRSTHLSKLIDEARSRFTADSNTHQVLFILDDALNTVNVIYGNDALTLTL